MMKRRIRSLIGLDIGSKAVKAVELTWSGGLVITGFGYAELPAPDAVADTVARLFQENEFHTRRVVTAVSGKSVIVRYLTMFKMSPEDLRNAIRYEADKYIPFDVEEVVLDCQPFEAPGLGVRELSLTPSVIPRVRHLVRSLTLARCRSVAAHCRRLSTADEVDDFLRSSQRAVLAPVSAP